MDSFFKANWDAAVDKDNRKMGIGVIVIDGEGDVLAILLAPKDYIITPDIAKATVALRASNFYRELGLQRVVWKVMPSK
jgi:hypothetical protein